MFFYKHSVYCVKAIVYKFTRFSRDSHVFEFSYSKYGTVIIFSKSTPPLGVNWKVAISHEDAGWYISETTRDRKISTNHQQDIIRLYSVASIGLIPFSRWRVYHKAAVTLCVNCRYSAAVHRHDVCKRRCLHSRLEFTHVRLRHDVFHRTNVRARSSELSYFLPLATNGEH